MKTVLITGGLGFIGSAVVRHLLDTSDNKVVVVDCMTYAAMPQAVAAYSNDDRYAFERINICNYDAFRDALMKHQPEIVMHLAAESHVDRSIDSPTKFVETNVVGTVQVLQACRSYLETLSVNNRAKFRMHHISTDEVFGSLNSEDTAFTETSRYDPRSPYSASKAAADHFVRAWGETFGVPVVLSNCSNNYGPWQFPEKLVPVMITNGLDGKPLSIYGDGLNVRDWLHVSDHAEALWLVASRGKLGESYNVGGNAERTNVDVVSEICNVLDAHFPDRAPHSDLITYVKDRPGHDFRYAVNFDKITSELGWVPKHNFKDGMIETVKWYLENESWWRPILDGRTEPDRLGLSVIPGQ